MEDDLELIHEEKPVPQEKINDTIIKTILKIFKVEFKIEIRYATYYRLPYFFT